MSEPTTCPSCGAPIKVVSNTYIHEYVNHYEYVAPTLPPDVRVKQLKSFAAHKAHCEVDAYAPQFDMGCTCGLRTYLERTEGT